MNERHDPQPRDDDWSNALHYEHEHDKDMTMKLDDMLESKYLKKEDLRGEEVAVTVGKLTKVNLARDDEDPKYKWTVKFQEFAKPMVLNKTNLKRMFKHLGDDTTDWEGNQVIVYFDDTVMFGDEEVGGLRIKGMKKASNGAKRKTDDDVNAELADATGGDPPF